MSFPILNHALAPEVHASTLLLLNDRLLCAWFGGTKEGHGDTKIWLSEQKFGSLVWSEPEVIASGEGIPHWNPVLFKHPGSGKITLFYKEGTPISSWSTLAKISEDNGQTWSKKRELVSGDKGGRGPVKNKCTILSNGNILAPASIETPDGGWHCFADCSMDDCRTWTRSSIPMIDRTKLTGEGAIQPSLIESSSAGRVSMFTRSSTGFVLRSDSKDFGRSWGETYQTPLFNNNSGIDALALGHRWLIVHNNINQNWGARTPLVVSVSEDEGLTWRVAIALEDKPPPLGFNQIDARDTGIQNDGVSEFSYPAIISDGEGGVHISYTYERVGIKVVHIASTQLEQLCI